MLKLSSLYMLMLWMAVSTTDANADTLTKQRVLGAGPSIAVSTLFFEMFSKLPAANGFSFDVEQRSTKHAGGIRASDTYLFGRTGRPLSQSERDLGKLDLFLSGVPVGFVVGPGVGIETLTYQQAKKLFTNDITNWSEIGGNSGSVILAGRERTEATLTVLSKEYPFLMTAIDDHTFKRDHTLVNFIRSEPGQFAIGYGAFPNFNEHETITVAGHSPNIQIGLVIDERNIDNPLVKSALTFTKSPEWLNVIKSLGLLPPNNE